MNRLQLVTRIFGVAAIGLLIAACNGADPSFGPGPGTGTGTGSGDGPCTDPMKCCAPEEMVCTGDPETGGVICTCDKLWDCSLNPNKCEQPAPNPPGGGDWDCTWSEFKYVCEKSGEKGDPPGGGGWTCSWDGNEFKWVCTKDGPPPNPNNNPGGTNVWDCKVIGDKLVCEKDGGTAPPPTGGGTWTCKDATGKVCQPGSGPGCKCVKTDNGGGLPPGGGNWKCNKVNMGGIMTWVCYGEVPPGGSPPGGNGWDCTKVGTQNQNELWKCVKPDEPGDTPPGGGHFSCAKGTEFNGTICEEVDKPPTPPTPYPKPGEKCVPGTKMWCDGLQYCGWGQVTCKPDGSWPTKSVNGKQIIDCQELTSGARPNTVCACYHFFFNPACCERPDCMVPQGSQGQICPKSPGKLCDYCNPQKKDCTEPGGFCLVTNTMETFCGKGCTIDGDCPKDFRCIKVKNWPQKQCIPSDSSCYY